MKINALTSFVFIVLLSTNYSCNTSPETGAAHPKIPVIFDTDANNELDDQHALAYLLSNQDLFSVVGVTVNSTRNGGLIQGHYDEALRVLTLFNDQELPLKKGADKTFGEIRPDLGLEIFDGSEAVDYIIEETKKCEEDKIVLIAIGKLTNVALAVEKDPEILDKIRLVWLGSNYPDPGEYNLENDTSALSYLLATNIHFEMVNVAYGSTRGTDYIRVSVPEVDSIMPGKGPEIKPGITGRHGGIFTNFGDYSVNLFHHIEVYGDPPSRALFDVGAVAVVKDPAWGEAKTLPAPKYLNNQWIEQPENERKIILWENFNKEEIIKDFYEVLD